LSAAVAIPGKEEEIVNKKKDKKQKKQSVLISVTEIAKLLELY